MNVSSFMIRRGILISVPVLVSLLSACSPIVENQVPSPTPQVVTTTSANTYVVRRAAIQTPARQSFEQYRPNNTGVKRDSSPKRAVAVNVQKPKIVQASYTRPSRPSSNKHQSAQARPQPSAAQANPARRPAVQASPASTVAVAPQRRATSQAPAPLTREQYHQRYQAELKRRQMRNTPPRQRVVQGKTQAQPAARQPLGQSSAKPNVSNQVEQRVENIIQAATQHLGTQYAWGGAKPSTGFDCSGLVQHSIKQAVNVSVPRTAAEQYNAAVKVPFKEAARGDLVFFRTNGRRHVNHVGIYLGKGKFVHAPRAGKQVTTANLNLEYWKRNLVGFGRIPGVCRIPA